MATSEHLSRRDFLKLTNEGLKALFPTYGVTSDLITSAKNQEPHVSPGTAVGILLRLKGDTVEPVPEIEWDGMKDAEPYRSLRRIKPFLTDYVSDEDNLSLGERVDYYRLLNSELGINQLRTEFRMSDVVNQDGSFNQVTLKSYKDTLLAMQEAGLEPPIIVLFTPSEWQLELAEADPEKFYALYQTYLGKIADLFEETGIFPSHLQVLNEINTSIQTKFSFDQVVKLIEISADLFKHQHPETKIMTSILTDLGEDWQEFTRELIDRVGHKLDVLGFDYYPCYSEPLGPYLPCQSPFTVFTDTSVYAWLAQEKLQGILQPFEIMLSETGAPSIEADSRIGRLQYDRMIQVLDHFLLEYERQGHKAEEIFSAIGFFAGGDWPAVVTKAPWRLDFTPFTLLRQTNGNWEPTFAGKRLKDLIQTRINPSANSVLTLINSSSIINSQ